MQNGYVLDLEVVRPGDIVLSTSSAKISWWIRFFTWSRFSHAMLYVGRSIIHADQGGVFTLNPQRKIVKKGQIAVYRIKGEGLTEEQCVSIVNYARSKVGCLYSVPQAMRTVFRWWTSLRTTTDEQFCSRLVAQAYEAAGVKLVPNPDFCSPGRLIKSGCLELVEDAVRPADERDFRVAESPDTLATHLTHTFQWLNEVREVARRESFDVSSIDSAFQFVEQHPEYDVLVAECIEKSGYLADYRLDEVANPHRYRATIFLAKEGVGAQAVRIEAAINIDLANSAVSGVIKYGRRQDLAVFRQEADLHLARARQVLERFAVLTEVCGHLGLRDEAQRIVKLTASINRHLDAATKLFGKEGKGAVAL